MINTQINILESTKFNKISEDNKIILNIKLLSWRKYRKLTQEEIEYYKDIIAKIKENYSYDDFTKLTKCTLNVLRNIYEIDYKIPFISWNINLWINTLINITDSISNSYMIIAKPSHKKIWNTVNYIWEKLEWVMEFLWTQDQKLDNKISKFLQQHFPEKKYKNK